MELDVDAILRHPKACSSTAVGNLLDTVFGVKLGVLDQVCFDHRDGKNRGDKEGRVKVFILSAIVYEGVCLVIGRRERLGRQLRPLSTKRCLGEQLSSRVGTTAELRGRSHSYMTPREVRTPSLK